MSKPAVRYAGKAEIVGGHAWLYPLDHPNHLEGHDVSNQKLVRTSMVVSVDDQTGRIETKNTTYLPEEKTS